MVVIILFWIMLLIKVNQNFAQQLYETVRKSW